MNEEVKYVDLEGLSYFKDKIDENYVKKETGKDLSTNDYTDAEKNKLASLENYDDTEIKEDMSEIVGSIDDLSGDVADLETNKADKSTTYTKNEVDNLIPDVSNFVTKSVNDLVNYYLKSETYTKTEVNSLIGAISSISFEVVSELPATGQSNIIYLVPSIDPSSQNIKDEYIWVNNSWEKIGSTSIDLSGYVTTTELNTALADYATSNEVIQALSNYTTTTDLTTLLATKANISDIPTVPTNVSAFTNDVGYLTQHQDISGKENISNKTTTINSSSTNTEYPSALAVYNLFNSIVDGDEVAY